MAYYTYNMSSWMIEKEATEQLPLFYNASIMISLLIPLGAVIQGILIKKMIKLLNENRKLIKTIQTILEMFPESVIIQSVDKFTNK
jgi:hypothetical protein